MANKTDLKAGLQLTYLHEGNHSHTKLISSDPIEQIPSLGTTGGQWVRLYTLTTWETQFQPYFSGEIELMGGNVGGPYVQYGKFQFTFRIKNITTTPVYELVTVYDSSNLLVMVPADFSIVMTQNDTANNYRTLEIYVKVKNAWDDLGFRLNWRKSYRVGIQADGKTFVSSPPATIPMTTYSKDVAVPANKTATAGNEITYANGWAANAATGNLKLTQMPSGLVQMQGTISNPTLSNWTTAGTVITTLPSGFFNPNNTQIFNAMAYTNAFVPNIAVCKITTAGDLKLDKYLETGAAPTVVPQYMSFGGISYMNV